MTEREGGTSRAELSLTMLVQATSITPLLTESLIILLELLLNGQRDLKLWFGEGPRFLGPCRNVRAGKRSVARNGLSLKVLMPRAAL